MYWYRWWVFLTDFGIARLSDDQMSMTKTGSDGDLGYMAPEQRTDAKGVDARADGRIGARCTH